MIYTINFTGEFAVLKSFIEKLEGSIADYKEKFTSITIISREESQKKLFVQFDLFAVEYEDEVELYEWIHRLLDPILDQIDGSSCYRYGIKDQFPINISRLNKKYKEILKNE